jgi:hypothetical protein
VLVAIDLGNRSQGLHKSEGLHQVFRNQRSQDGLSPRNGARGRDQGRAVADANQVVARGILLDQMQDAVKRLQRDLLLDYLPVIRFIHLILLEGPHKMVQTDFSVQEFERKAYRVQAFCELYALHL